MLVYPSGIDVSSSTLRFLTARLRARRRERGTRWRCVSAGRQALLALAHPCSGHTYAQLAAGFGVRTTAFRYMAEAVDVLAALAPSLSEAMKTASTKAFVMLDSTLLPIDRIAADRPFYSGKHGMNVQVLTDPVGRLLWASPALPGAVHDLNAARTHGVIDALAEAGVVCWAAKLPGRQRHHTRSLLGALGETVCRSAGRQPLTREDPRTRRTGHGHPQDLAAPAQAALLHHPYHQPRPGHPHLAPDLLKLRLVNAQCRDNPLETGEFRGPGGWVTSTLARVSHGPLTCRPRFSVAR